MLFVEGRFFLFFLAVFAIHWSLKSLKLRKHWLLVCSYAFYAGWDWRFLGLIFLSTLIDYNVGRRLEATEDPGKRKGWLWVSMVANLGFLGFFKYYNFFADSAKDFLGWMGLAPSDLTLSIVLPVGISFYTFQTMSYTIDVYRRRLKAVDHFWDFALFVSFFPQLVAGPIVRAIDFLPQLDENRSFKKHVAVRANLTLFLVGFIKKACLADNVAEYVVDPVFADPAAYSTLSNWIALASYHIQVYGDFAGYSDMAIATAGLLGYRLTENFNFPYFSPSIGEFWRRWHISLGTWLKDYLYIPLGGSWCSWQKHVRNIFITMVLCGLWHGAGWKFITFGALHAVYVSVNTFWKRSVPHTGIIGALNKYGAHLLTTYCLFFGWTIFRSEAMEKTLDQMRIFFFLDSGGPSTVSSLWGLFFLACAVVHYGCYKGFFRDLWAKLPDWGYALVYGASWALVLPWVPTGYRAFIYFQF